MAKLLRLVSREYVLTFVQDQGFLGVINIKVSDVLDLELGGQGECLCGFESRRAVG